jgi:hypothetical protein
VAFLNVGAARSAPEATTSTSSARRIIIHGRTSLMRMRET